jgi:hypothetical protein
MNPALSNALNNLLAAPCIDPASQAAWKGNPHRNIMKSNKYMLEIL